MAMHNLYQEMANGYDESFPKSYDNQENDEYIIQFALNSTDPQLVGAFKKRIEHLKMAPIWEEKIKEPALIQEIDEIIFDSNIFQKIDSSIGFYKKLTMVGKMLLLLTIYSAASFLGPFLIIAAALMMVAAITHLGTLKEKDNVVSTLVATTKKELDSTVKDGKALLMHALVENKSKVLPKQIQMANVESQTVVNSVITSSAPSRITRITLEGSILNKLRPKQPFQPRPYPNSISFPISSKRLFTKVFFNNTPVHAQVLLDIGANSNCMPKHLAEAIEAYQQHPLIRMNKNIAVRKYGDIFPSEVMPVTVVDMAFENGPVVKGVPFLLSNKGQTIIGMSFLSKMNTSINLGDNTATVVFRKNASHGINLPKLKQERKPKEYNLITPMMVTLLPFSAQVLEYEMEEIFEKEDAGDYEIFPQFDYEELYGPPYVEALSASKGKMTVVNNNPYPITMIEQSPLGTAIPFRKEEYIPENRLDNIVDRNYLSGNLPCREISCLCGFRKDKSVPLIYFCNEMGFNYQQHQPNHAIYPLRQLNSKMQRIIFDNDNLIFMLSGKQGYLQNWDVLSRKINSKARIVISYRETISQEMKTFFKYLYNKGVSIQILKIKNMGCNDCSSIANRDLPNIFSEADSFKIFITDRSVQALDHQRSRNHDSYPIAFHLGLYGKVCVYKSGYNIFVHFHLGNWLSSQHQYRLEYSIYLLMYHIGALKGPREISIFSSWVDIQSEDSKRIVKALELVPGWTTNPEYSIPKKRAIKLVLNKFQIYDCGCYCCSNLEEGRDVFLMQYPLLFSGPIGSLSGINLGSRVNLNMPCQVVTNKAIEMLENPIKKVKYMNHSFLEAANARKETTILKNPIPPQYRQFGPPNRIPNNNEKIEKEINATEICELEKVENPNPSITEEDQNSWASMSDLKETLEGYSMGNDPEWLLENKHRPDIDWRVSFTEDRLPDDPKLRERFIEIMDKHSSVFAHGKYQWRYIKTCPLKLSFDDSPQIREQPYPISEEKQIILDDKISKLLENDLIEVVSADMMRQHHVNILRTFLVPQNSHTKNALAAIEQDKKSKDTEPTDHEAQPGHHNKNGSLEPDTKQVTYRLVVDNRRPNETILYPKTMSYCIRPVQDLICDLGKFKYFIIADAHKGFRGFPCSLETSLRFAFSVNTPTFRDKVFRFKSISDGLACSPLEYQRCLMEILAPLGHRVTVYIDDIVCASEISPMHCLEIYEQALQLLNAAGVLINIHKLVALPTCKPNGHFNYLGFEFKKDAKGRLLRQVGEERKEIFRRIPIPTEIAVLRRFLGVIQHIVDFFPNFTAHLEKLREALSTKKNNPFRMKEEHVEAFNNIKKLLDDLPDLYVFSPNRTSYVHCDASFFGLGSVLFQVDPDTDEPLVILWFSRRFPTNIIVGDSSITKECISIGASLSKFERYLSLSSKTVIETDLSAAIQLLASNSNFTNSQMSRLSHKIFTYGFPFKLVHHAGHSNVIADALSRRFGMLVTATGCPLGMKEDLSKFREKLEKHVPPEWLQNMEIQYSDMIKCLGKTIMTDPDITDSLKKKRLQNLVSKVDQEATPSVIKFTKEAIESLNQTSTKAHIAGLDSMYMVHPIQNEIVSELLSLEGPRLSPPRNATAISPTFIANLHKADPEISRVNLYLLTTKYEDQDEALKHRFRLINGNILSVRKNPKKPWTPDNIAIYCTIRVGLSILAAYHLQYLHRGIQELKADFKHSFITPALTDCAKTIVNSCQHCFRYKWNKRRHTDEGRFNWSSIPGEIFYADLIYLPPTQENRVNYRKFLGIIDSMSRLFIVKALRADSKNEGETTKEVLNVLGNLFSYTRTPHTLKTDGSSIFTSEGFRKGLKALGVKNHEISTANYSKSNAIIESKWSLLRRLLNLNMLTFRRQNLIQVLNSTVFQINRAPIPALRKHSKDGNTSVSPLELFYGERPKHDIINHLLSNSSEKDRQDYWREYDQLIKEHNEAENKALQESNKLISHIHEIARDDIVLLKNFKKAYSHEKGTSSYHQTLYLVQDVNGKQLVISPLFRKGEKSRTVNAHDVKKYSLSKLITVIPKYLQDLLGCTYYTKQQLKELAAPPSVLASRLDPGEFPYLRNRTKNQAPTQAGLDFGSDTTTPSEDDSFIVGPGFHNNREETGMPPLDNLIPPDPALQPANPNAFQNLPQIPAEDPQVPNPGNENAPNNLRREIALITPPAEERERERPQPQEADGWDQDITPNIDKFPIPRKLFDETLTRKKQFKINEDKSTLHLYPGPSSSSSSDEAPEFPTRKAAGKAAALMARLGSTLGISSKNQPKDEELSFKTLASKTPQKDTPIKISTPKASSSPKPNTKDSNERELKLSPIQPNIKGTPAYRDQEHITEQFEDANQNTTPKVATPRRSPKIAANLRFTPQRRNSLISPEKIDQAAEEFQRLKFQGDDLGLTQNLDPDEGQTPGQSNPLKISSKLKRTPNSAGATQKRPKASPQRPSYPTKASEKQTARRSTKTLRSPIPPREGAKRQRTQTTFYQAGQQ